MVGQDAWKVAPIETENPEWRDLSEEWFEVPGGRCPERSAAKDVEGRDAGSRLGALFERLAGMTEGGILLGWSPPTVGRLKAASAETHSELDQYQHFG